MNGQESSELGFSGIFHANTGYVEEMYQKFLVHPSQVSREWQAYFSGFKEGFSTCVQTLGSSFGQTEQPASATAGQNVLGNRRESGLSYEISVYQLTRAYQEYGHRSAHINPLADRPPDHLEILNPEKHGISEDIMDTPTAVGVHFGWEPMPIRDYISRLRKLFCGSVGIEIEHLCTDEERCWLDARLSRILMKPEPTTRKALYSDLARADALEKTIATKYVGQKRFSVEGSDAQIAAIESLMDHAAAHCEATEFCLAMAHRGRLNVLVNIAQKPLKKLFAEFDGLVGEDTYGSGDVKYHCGWEAQRQTRSGHQITVSVSFNPSHLEFVDSVVMGETRAIQDIRHQRNRKSAIPVILHGDAAFAGQGVVYESMQMMSLRGHSAGGAIHIVANNQIGFTTNPSDSRSSMYCSDIGKAFGSPIFHVNGDSIDELHQVMCLAAEYRQTFAKDVIMDIVCFRRHGHNEGDEPGFTQPLMYRKIKKLKAPYETYLKKLTTEDGQTFDETQLKEVYQQFRNEMNAVYDAHKEQPDKVEIFPESRKNQAFIYGDVQDILQAVDTAISETKLKELGEKLVSIPEGFVPNKKLERIIIQERKQMLSGEKPIDWGLGELLAYASLLDEGHSIRLCGQDAGRGTFAHRHAVLIDSGNESRHIGLDATAQSGARLEIIDSFLSETAALGFEYGYASRHLNALTIWEAQFGDFSNGAQVMIDQFLVSGESKWGQSQGLVLLLPHGYEGQGPEHSSARLERFLQLAAEANMQVCYFTKISQLFHALRRQLKRNFRKPLVVMSPKSFLRSPRAAVPISELTQGQFHEVLLDERPLDPNQVTRIVMCSGKIALDALAHAEAVNDPRETETTAILRIEQLYPLHDEKIKAALLSYPQVKQCFWAQEEPQNMGAYFSIHEDLEKIIRSCKIKGGLKYLGRSRRASPAVGLSKIHVKEHSALVDAIFTKNETFKI